VKREIRRNHHAFDCPNTKRGRLLGNNYLIVRHGSDSWEWEYRGNIFYDLEHLTKEVLRRSGASSRLARFFTERVPDQRMEFRA
jgi:hypothetical protein